MEIKGRILSKISVSKKTFLFLEVIFLLIFLILAVCFFIFSYLRNNTLFTIETLFAAMATLLTIIIIFGTRSFLTDFINKQTKVIEYQKSEIVHQNQTLMQQNEEIEAQRDEIEVQRDVVIKQKKEIMDSIHYAFRIQTAIMPPFHFIDKILPEYFILYKPKDVVSGDFYFVDKIDDTVIFAAVDCTGHGVPGAMMSVIGYNYLNLAVRVKHLKKPSEILKFLDEGVNEMLRQTGNESGVKDGMDIGLCSLNIKNNELQFSGAYNGMYLVINNELTEIKPDKFPIGNNVFGVSDDYTNHVFNLNKGDIAYLLSDGYADQFGGPKGRKFMYKQLREYLNEIKAAPMLEQRHLLADKIEMWRGDLEQVDDILLMGVRI